MKRSHGRMALSLLIPVAWMVATGVTAVYFFRTVDLKPKVSEDFFFASDDPEFQEGNQIYKIFPQYSQPIIVSARGDIHSRQYALNARQLTEALSKVPDSVSVHSITQGPRNVKEAFKSPLWRRLLIGDDEKATHFILSLRNIPGAKLVKTVERVEKIADFCNQPGFEIIVSGPPYIMELIRRNLLQDLKVFSLAALAIFTVVMLAVFRSVWILLGTIVSCMMAAMGTLYITHWLKIPIGPLTANLSTIVVVLTLSYISFIAFTWKYLMEKERDAEHNHHVWDTVRLTFVATFWSMAASFPGFLSCIFVPAIPLRQLGISSSIGTLVAFIAALTVFPWFLWPAHKSKKNLAENFYIHKQTIRHHFSKRHAVICGGILLFTGVCAGGIALLNPDPNLLSYFKKGTTLYEGLNYIDRNGGSSPLQMVIRDDEGKKLNNDRAYKKLWQLHRALETYSPVGTLLSQPLVMAEAKIRIPFPIFDILGWENILSVMEKPEHQKITSYFLTPDRKRSLLFLRMQEGERKEPREVIVGKVKEIVRQNGFEPELTGGVYLLQGKLTKLVVNSLLQSLVSLVVIFAATGFLLTVSIRLTLALFVSAAVIPTVMLGVIGFSRIPIDLISAPATNISLGMGMDAMLHMLIWARFCQKKKGMPLWESWVETRIHMWKPVVSDAVIVCSGFLIFCLSTFPPTTRFGLAVVVGSLMCPLAALYVLPFLAGAPIFRRHHPHHAK